MQSLSSFSGEERVTSDGRVITAFPVSRRLYTPENAQPNAKKRVCAYARVSTDHEEQQTSYEAQIDYYSRTIQGNPAWEYCGMYSDEGISATSTAKREGFKQMIADAMAGKIDMILTKSVSRFARNTVDSLMTIRALKDKGVGVFFEKENIDSLDGKGELLLTLMSSLAQEESRSISENTTWGQRKRFADGKVTMPFSRFLGYDRGEDGKPIINEEEAKTVRLIYALFLDGRSPSTIARELMRRGIKSPGGCDTWQKTTVESILTNEKYRGDALLQKKFTVNFLTKKMKRNQGEVRQYYVQNSHPAIISGELFDLAQVELRSRRKSGHKQCSGSIFASKIHCGECGGVFGSKKWHSTDQYSRTVWQCNDKYKGATKCPAPHLSEDQIKQAFVNMVNAMMSDKEQLLAAYDEVIASLLNTSALEDEKRKLEAEGKTIHQQLMDWINENASRAMPQTEYQKRYDELSERLNASRRRLDTVKEAILLKDVKRDRARAFMATLRTGQVIEAFDEKLWSAMVDKLMVYTDKLVFTLRDGTTREMAR